MMDVPKGYTECDTPCPHCNFEWFDYRQNGPHMAAYCMNCGGFIKFVTKADSKKKMSAWKKAIKERDSYTCQRCGKLLDSTKLDAHHKMPVWFMDQLKFDIDNGITLCKACHHALHGAGGTINESKED